MGADSTERRTATSGRSWRLRVRLRGAREKREESEEYTALSERIEEHSDAVDETIGDMSSDLDFVGAVRELTDEDATPQGGQEQEKEREKEQEEAEGVDR